MGQSDRVRALTPAAFEARVLGFISLGLVTLGLLYCLPAIPQDLSYHAFADGRTLLGVPNLLNVVSNLPFLVVGGLGVWLLIRYDALRPAGPPLSSPERWPLAVLFTGIFLTGFGSAYYHLVPDNDRLVWDRLPMTLAFMGFFASMIGERMGTRAGLWLLGPLVWLGLASVLNWHQSEQRGAGDLRLYYFVQFYPMLAIPLLIYLFPARYTRDGDIFIALGWYVLAKVVEREFLDRGVLGVTGSVSGHTLKHLAAAAGAYWLFLRVRFRLAIPASSGV